MDIKKVLPKSSERVELNTKIETNSNIKENTIDNLNRYNYADIHEISERIDELNSEWDTERVLEANAAAIIFISTILGFHASPYWFIFVGVISFFLFQHAIQGWCPPLPLIRKIGVRTRKEIDNERIVLKFLRGDFEKSKEDYLKIYEETKEQ